MPNTFTNAQQICTVSLTDVYTCPSTNTNGNVAASVIILLQATNTSTRADVLTVVWTDASNGNQAVHIVDQVPVPAQQTIGCLTGRLALMPGDKIRAQCGTFQAIELSLSALETS